MIRLLIGKAERRPNLQLVTEGEKGLKEKDENGECVSLTEVDGNFQKCGIKE